MYAQSTGIVCFFLQVTWVLTTWRWSALTTDNGQVSNTTNGPRFNHDSILSKHGQLLIIFSQGQTWTFNLQTKEYKLLNTKMACGSCKGMVSGSTDEALYAGMGLTRNDHIKTYTNKMWIFLFSTMQWSEFTTSDLHRPAPRTGAAGAFHSPRSRMFYVAMGYGRDGYHSDVYSLDVITHIWKKEIEHSAYYLYTAPRPRYQHSIAMVTEYKMALFGGCQSVPKSGGSCPSSDLWTLDLLAKTWVEHGNCAMARSFGTLVTLRNASNRGQGELLLYGGLFNFTSYNPKVPADEVTELNFINKSPSIRHQSVGEVPAVRSGALMYTSDIGVYMTGGVLQCSDCNSTNVIYLLTREVANSTDSEEMKAEVYSCSPRRYLTMRMLHALFMLVAMVIAMPIALFLTRCSKSKRFTQFIIALRVIGYLCLFSGVVTIAWTKEKFHLTSIHGIIGIIVSVLAALRILNVILRQSIRHNKEPSGCKYECWSLLLSMCGWAAILLGVVNVTLGIMMLLPRWVLWTWFGWAGVFCLAYLLLVSCTDNRKKIDDQINDLTILDRYGTRSSKPPVDANSEKL